MSLHKIYYPIIVLVFVPISVWSQELNTIDFLIDDGLPSTEVHDIYEDINGYLWLASDRGIARFNGQRFQVWDSESGLPNIVNFNFFEENPHKVWVANVLNELYWFDPVSFPLQFTPYSYNDSLRDVFSAFKWVQHIRHFWIDDQGNFKFTFLLGPGLITIDKTGTTTVSNWEFDDLGDLLFKSYEDSDVVVHLWEDGKRNLCTEFTPKAVENERTRVKINDHIHDTIIWDDQPYRYYSNHLLGVADYSVNDQAIFFSLGNAVYKYSNFTLKSTEVSGDVLRIKQKDSAVYVGTTNGLFKLDENINIIEQLLSDGTHVTDIYWDRTGAMWVSTANKGLILTINENIRSVSFGEETIKPFTNIEVNEDYIIVMTWDNHLFILDKGLNEIYRQQRTSFISGLYTCLPENNGLNQFLEPRKGTFYKNGGHEEHVFYSLKWYEYDSLYCFNRDVSSISADSSTNYFLGIPKIYAGAKYQNEFLLATEQGLYLCDKNANVRKYNENNKILSDKLIAIKPFRNGFVIGSYLNGVLFLRNDSLFTLGKLNGLVSSSISCIEIENESTLWVGTYEGLEKIQVGNSLSQIHIEHLNSSKGLSSNEIMSIDYYNDTIWVGTKRGVNYFRSDLDIIPQIFLKDLFMVDSIKINGQKIDVQTRELNINETGVIELFFEQIVYTAKLDVSYEYRLLPEDKDWIPAGPSYLRFSNLSAGEYELQIRAACENDRGKPVLFKINVQLPWYKTLWAIVLYILFGIGMLTLIFRLLLKRLDKRRTAELEKVQLELKALISQMNPHFTFNTINSIQHYIIENDSRMALNYLSEFAMLMRQSLDFSRREFITLREEIEFLKLYLELESKRFGKHIQFNVQLETHHDPEILAFPALLLQPIIENAVVHGLHGLDYPGVITVIISERQDYFDITISDNGKGIQKGSKKVSSNHKSHGLDILKNRIQLYNAVQGKSSDVQILHNVDEDQGTVVKIRLYKVRNL